MKSVTTALVIVAIAAAMLVAPSLFGSYNQEAKAQAGKSVQGRGTGTVTCPAIATPISAEIFFSRDRFKGGSFAGFNIVDPSSDTGKGGFQGSAQISPNHYTLQVIEDGDSLCEAPVPTSATISRQCGQSVSIQFTAANGERGTFTGNVACLK